MLARVARYHHIPVLTFGPASLLIGEICGCPYSILRYGGRYCAPLVDLAKRTQKPAFRLPRHEPPAPVQRARRLRNDLVPS
jgi:hypothetical protein